MRFKVSGIPADGIEEELKLPIKLHEITLKEGVRVFIKIQKIDDAVLVEGMAEGNALMICSRCLKEFISPVKTNFNVEYVPGGPLSREEEHELTGRELDISFYEEDEIDIEALVREQILLAVPMKPLCSADCRGICPTCGANLNETACKCGKEEIDPRLAPLKKLKESLKFRK